MSVAQVWLIIGIPALGIGAAALLGRSRLSVAIGYLALAGGFVAMAALHRISGAVFAVVLVLVYATGRGAGFERHGPVISAGRTSEAGGEEHPEHESSARG